MASVTELDTLIKIAEENLASLKEQREKASAVLEKPDNLRPTAQAMHDKHCPDCARDGKCEFVGESADSWDAPEHAFWLHCARVAVFGGMFPVVE